MFNAERKLFDTEIVVDFFGVHGRVDLLEKTGLLVVIKFNWSFRLQILSLENGLDHGHPDREIELVVIFLLGLGLGGGKGVNKGKCNVGSIVNILYRAG